MVVYQEDITIFSQMLEEQQHKLCANLDKFTFGLTHVQYMGYIIDEQGVHMDPTKIQVIRDWPSPTTLTELCSFLGLVIFYHRFVLGLSIDL